MSFKVSEQESKHESKIAPLATIIGSLVGLLIIIITSQRFGAFLPTKLFYFLVTILVLAVVVFVFYAASPPILRWCQRILIKRKQSKVILNNFEDFKYFIEKFEEFADLHGRDNIAKVLYTVGVIDDPTEKNVITFTDNLVDQSIFYSFFSLYKVFRDKISYKKPVTENFKFIAEEFDAILELYNSLILRSVEKIKILSKGKIFSDSKESYKKYRDLYISYIKEYIGFSEKMNKKFGEKYFRAYFDFPKEL